MVNTRILVSRNKREGKIKGVYIRYGSDYHNANPFARVWFDEATFLKV